MAKPIPVFSFAFAAFAATSTRVRSGDGERLSEDELFLTMWRASSRARADLAVRIGLSHDGSTAALCDRNAALTPDIEQIWLTQITETTRGFSGAAPAAAQRLPQVGRRVDFDLKHILGWTLNVNAKTRPGEELPGIMRNVKILADLDFS